MDLTALARTVVIGRLVALEADAAHFTALAAVADAYAHVAREKADAAQRTLSEVKVWLALLPDDARLELCAPKPASASPPELLGVRPRLSAAAPPKPSPSATYQRPSNGLPQRLPPSVVVGANPTITDTSCHRRRAPQGPAGASGAS
jgi:hypothetical protein